LIDIENKLTVTGFRKQRFIEGKKVETSKHLMGVEERLHKAREDEEDHAKAKLEKLIYKMEKGRCRSAKLVKRKAEKGPKPIDENIDFMERMEEKNLKQSILEKQKVESLKEKEKKIASNMEKRKNDWSELIAERRELWHQKKGEYN